jgi:hypothetical protein
MPRYTRAQKLAVMRIRYAQYITPPYPVIYLETSGAVTAELGEVTLEDVVQRVQYPVKTNDTAYLTPETSGSVAGSMIEATVTRVRVRYEDWPVETTGSVHATFQESTLIRVVIRYTDWPLETSGSVHATFQEMTLTTVVVRYEFWPVETSGSVAASLIGVTLT